jgi:hypothetical protein
VGVEVEMMNCCDIEKPLLFVTPSTVKISKNCENVIFNVWYLTKYPTDIRRCYSAKNILLDSGISPIFERMKLKEYPQEYLENYHVYVQKIVRRIKQNNPTCKVFAVIPDYPADLPDNPINDNVEKTIKNWIKFKDIPSKDFIWMPSLQAKKLDFESFKYSIEKFKEIFGENYQIAGIGSVCKWKNVRVIEKYCKIARKKLTNTWLHAFGPTIKALPYIWKYINSFDSITINFCFVNSKGSEDVWKKYMRKFDFLKYFGSLNKFLLNSKKNEPRQNSSAAFLSREARDVEPNTLEAERGELK